MSRWIFNQDAYEKIAHIINAGTASITAYKDFTCALPITLLIDTDEREVFISINWSSQRKSTIFQKSDYKNKGLLIEALVSYVSQIINGE